VIAGISLAQFSGLGLIFTDLFACFSNLVRREILFDVIDQIDSVALMP